MIMSSFLEYQPPSSRLVQTTRSADTRTEEEIVEYIKSHRPVTHQKNVWAFWDKGWDEMKPWTRRNIVDWVRRLSSSGWEVRVLDVVPDSPRHISVFLEEEMLPRTFYDMNGRHAPQHRSDIVRVLLLYLHGGFWSDVGGVLVRGLDDIWSKIADPADPTEVMGFAPVFAGKFTEDRPLGNTFLGASKGCQFLELWHRVFCESWRDRTDSAGIRNHPLFAHLLPFKMPPTPGEGVTPLDSDVVADYIPQFHAAGRLFALEDPSIGWDGPEFLRDKVMLLSMDEMFRHGVLTGYDGSVQFAHFSLPFAPGSGPEQDAAETFVRTVLEESVIVKFSQGVMPEPVQLATIWDRKENHGKDAAPGTWAEYFRWASVHLEQTRELVPLTHKEKAALSMKVWTAGVLEVIGAETPVRPTSVM
ncbi:hypothetical protein EXIGLDRAFT_684191 [Exidia glandulosa HHB12029]|uniref:Capsule polysaccharide biosynthesis protein n=1 Tax=Exidia glandulosa HHB12029 TaxID=1314781 RepID=A0A165CU80_EXIGL|nr:hypothetical protein EXIGLDRAFT_684191 [Exidia glandulosa HHB12029]